MAMYKVKLLVRSPAGERETYEYVSSADAKSFKRKDLNDATRKATAKAVAKVRKYTLPTDRVEAVACNCVG